MGRQTNAAYRRNQGQARQKAAQARAAGRRRERRRRLVVIVGSAVAVLGVVAAIVVVGLSSSGSGHGSGSRPAAAASVVHDVTAVPAATLDKVGKGSLTAPPKAVKDAALTTGGKPEVLYIGAEFCPYCAGERWALVQALSRFGTFSNLASVHSSPTDVFPNTPTFSFHGATYRSDTLAFTARELETVTGAKLETPTAAESAVWHRYTGTAGSFPFVDIAGRYVATGPSYDESVLKGLTAEQIAAALADPTSPVAQAIDGAANVLTAAICATTNGQPAAVCSAAGVTAAGKTLSG